MSDQRPRIHQVSCSVVSKPEGTDSFEKAEAMADKLERYARKLGFAVMSENVDEAEYDLGISAVVDV